jgi:hypothetical protein
LIYSMASGASLSCVAYREEPGAVFPVQGNSLLRHLDDLARRSDSGTKRGGVALNASLR